MAGDPDAGSHRAAYQRPPHANPDHAKQVVQLLQQDGSPVGQLVGTIDADKVIVAQNIIGTINM